MPLTEREFNWLRRIAAKLDPAGARAAEILAARTGDHPEPTARALTRAMRILRAR